MGPTFSCETCKKTFFRKHALGLGNHNLEKKNKKLQTSPATLLKGEMYLKDEFSPIGLTKGLTEKVPKFVPMKKKVRLDKVSKPPVSGWGKRKFVDGVWVCTLCQVSTKSYCKLNAHLDTVHRVKIAKYTCNICEYTSYNNYKKALQHHTKSKRHLQLSAEWADRKGQDGQREQDLVMYSCERCQMTFFMLHQYNSHLKTKIHKMLQKREEDHAEPSNNNNIDIGSEVAADGDGKDHLMSGLC